MVFHQATHLAMCHYCESTSALPAMCPACSGKLLLFGLGIQRTESEIARKFPTARLARVDSDTMTTPAQFRKVFGEFAGGELDILLGTQMVAKGLDFPGVKLVGIVNADTGFQLPDFRAAERTFDLLVQVSGRAGRALPDGTVLIQTFRPGNPAIVMAKEGRLEEFYAVELATRRELGFPPFSRLIRIVVRGRNASKAASAITDLAGHIAKRVGDAGELLGPAECPIARISGSHRSHIILRTTRFGETHERLAAALEDYRAPGGVYLEIDVDPLALL